MTLNLLCAVTHANYITLNFKEIVMIDKETTDKMKKKISLIVGCVLGVFFVVAVTAIIIAVAKAQ